MKDVQNKAIGLGLLFGVVFGIVLGPMFFDDPSVGKMSHLPSKR